VGPCIPEIFQRWYNNISAFLSSYLTAGNFSPLLTNKLLSFRGHHLSSLSSNTNHPNSFQNSHLLTFLLFDTSRWLKRIL
jgi:hypothetical protein